MADRLGTASWADPAVVEDTLGFRDGTIWLGRLDNEAPIGYGDDRHVCLVSGSRGGKGASSIVCNLAQWPGSIVVLDPKGENATVTAARRGAGSADCEGLGQTVHVLDPFGAARVDDNYRSRFNPLEALAGQGDETVDEAGRLADAIVVVRDESSDPFWDESARTMLKGLILHVLTAPQFEGRRTLVTVRSLITRGDAEFVQALKDKGEDDPPSAQRLLWWDMSQNMSFGGVIASTGSTFLGMLGNAPKQFESVLQVANQNTEFIESPAMQRCLAGSDFALSELKTNAAGVSLYLCLPQRYMNTHYRWLRMLISMTVSEMEITRGRPAAGAPVLFVLDEFAGLKRMQVIETAVAQIAGHGGKLWFVLQSLEQLKAVYKDNWETFLSNAGLKIFFGLEDHFSRDYVSKLIGDTEIIREMQSITDSTSESESRSTSRSETFGTSESRSRSVSGGTNESISHSESHGTNASVSHSRGRSAGESFQRGGFFGLENVNRQFSVGRNQSVSHTQGTSHSTSVSRSQGTSQGWSESETAGSSRSVGTTVGTTQGTTRGRSTGLSETVHRRALVAPDEIGKLFARVDDPSDPRFPGLALVLIAGQSPIPLRRVNYWDDPAFIERFDPHPDHAPRPLFVSSLKASALAPFRSYFPAMYVNALAAPGDIVVAGQPLIGLAMPSVRERPLLSAVTGRLHQISADDRNAESLVEVVSYDQASSDSSTFDAMHAWVADTKRKVTAEAAAWKHFRVGGMAIVIALIVLGVVTRAQGGDTPWEWLVWLAGVVFFAYTTSKVRYFQSAIDLYAKSFATPIEPWECRPHRRAPVAVAARTPIQPAPEQRAGAARVTNRALLPGAATSWAATVDSMASEAAILSGNNTENDPLPVVSSARSVPDEGSAVATPFGISAEDFARLPEAAQQALRAQAATPAHDQPRPVSSDDGVS